MLTVVRCWCGWSESHPSWPEASAAGTRHENAEHPETALGYPELNDGLERNE